MLELSDVFAWEGRKRGEASTKPQSPPGGELIKQVVPDKPWKKLAAIELAVTRLRALLWLVM